MDGLWYANNYNYWGESKPANITGGPHIVVIIYPICSMVLVYSPIFGVILFGHMLANIPAPWSILDIQRFHGFQH